MRVGLRMPSRLLCNDKQRTRELRYRIRQGESKERNLPDPLEWERKPFPRMPGATQDPLQEHLLLNQWYPPGCLLGGALLVSLKKPLLYENGYLASQPRQC